MTPTMRRIAQDVAASHGLTASELTSRRKTKAISAARAEAWARIYATRKFSYPQIASGFNHSHVAVLKGVRRHNERGAA